MILDGKDNTITFIDKTVVKLTEDQTHEIAMTFMILQREGKGAPWSFIWVLGAVCAFLLYKVYL